MKIAIQGHPTRGNEVIQILESLGGKNTSNHKGKDNYAYYISSVDNRIYKTSILFSEYKHYTLEEFEREFPFKIGDKVIWPVKVGWWSGIIVDLSPDYYRIIDDKCNYHFVGASKLKLYSMQKERNITLTLDKAKEWYNKGGELKEIALQAFNEAELNPLPRSWDEYCRRYEFCCFSTRYVNIPLKYDALIKLEQLRNCWCNGWEPDWNDDQQSKYCIVHNQEFKITILYETRRFLSFPTKEMAEEFLKCFKDLIETAGDLI